MSKSSHKKQAQVDPPIVSEPKHDPLTPQGYLEGFGRFAVAAKSARGRRGRIARAVIYAFLAAALVAVLFGAIDLVRQIF